MEEIFGPTNQFIGLPSLAIKHIITAFADESQNAVLTIRVSHPKKDEATISIAATIPGKEDLTDSATGPFL
jgi:hypothetical protein